MARTPLEIIQQHIDRFKELQLLRDALTSPKRMKELDIKITTLQIVKLHIEAEQEAEAHEQRLQGKEF